MSSQCWGAWGNLCLSTHVYGVRTAIQGVLVAVKKKTAAKKVAKKAPAKKAAAKKSVAKKSVAKKKTTAKRVVKKSAVKKVAKKAPAKKAAAKKTAVKKVAKKAPVKKVAKKAPVKRVAKKTAPNKVVTPVATTTARPVVSAPVVTKPAPVTAKPAATPKQGTSGRVVFAVVVGIVLLAAIVWSKSGSEGDDGAAAPSIPSASASASASESASASASPSESAAVAAVEAPSKFVALKTADGLNLRWVAPSATEGLTGYNVEIRANGVGDWTTIATVPADQLMQAVSKSGSAGWTQFRVSSVYTDGQTASATVFGIPGEFK